ncbi:glutamate receptor ionotropic, kainate glr-3 [Culicoides brevitarsis]|uniref:glutamate receptor ionotropic, kainate glr-3 n=1 Tax=Culicoides brevitarsis TaxID=469753 RepID=UPI00307BEFF5
MAKNAVFIEQLSPAEDLLDPDPETLEVLTAIRRNACEAYVIFLSNGIQMEHFLSYGDSNRTLSPNSKYIILHDYRLFTPEQHYIWKRFINVVFIRLYNQKSYVSYQKAGLPFELSTVSFPSTEHSIFVSSRIDIWQSGKFRFNKELFVDRTANMKSEQLKVIVFTHTPAVTRIYEGMNFTYGGVEVKIMEALQDVMNFTAIFYELEHSDDVKWGQMNENGSYTGLLKEMDDAKSDFALADLHYTTFNLQVLDLSIPYNTECLTFLTPEATSDNSWKTLILPFSGTMWAGVLTSLFSVGFIFYGVSFIYRRLHGPLMMGISDISTENHEKKKKINSTVPPDMFDKLSDCIIYTYSMLLYVSLPKFPLTWSLRLLTGWYWIYCILIVVAYRASMTAILSNPFPRFTIDTIEELVYSKLGIGIWGDENRGFFLMSEDKDSQEIGQKAESYVDALEATKKVAEGKFALYENEYFLKEMRSKVKATESKLSLHVMSQCSVQIPVSIGLEKNSPIKSQVDKYIRRLIEAGLISKWLKDTVQNFDASEEEAPPEALVDLKKLYAGFVALAIGYSLGVLSLICEILFWKYFIARRPNFDKYELAKLYRIGT